MSSILRASAQRHAAGLLLVAVIVAAGIASVAGEDTFRRRAVTGPVSPAAASARPNIVVVMADDMRADDLRFMPQVRRLIKATGLEFRNSFSPFPLCCPARASFLTGQYAHNHHIYSHAEPWGFQAFDDRQTLATALQDSGYHTGFIGKYLNGYGSQPSRVTGSSSFRYVPPGWTDWYGAVARPVDSGYDSGGPYNYFNTLFNVNGSLDDSHRGQYQTDVIGGFARRLVSRYHGSSRPFFLYVSSVAPHMGQPAEPDDPRALRMADGDRIRVKTPARPRWVRGRFDAVIPRASGRPVDDGPSEPDMSDKPATLRRLPEPTPAEWRAVRTLTRQRAEALYVLDREVGRLVERLRVTGELATTVLMFTSDNGYFLGEHRMRQGKIKAHEPSLRVPFLVSGKGVPHGVRYDPVTTPGVTATIAELAGATMPFPPDGTSVAPAIRGGDQGWTVPVVTEGRDRSASFPGDPRSTIGIRTGRWKYVRYGAGEEELYDLDADPNEQRGLQHLPRYGDTLLRLRQLWLRFKDCAGQGCRTPLPADLQRAPADGQAATDRQSAAVHRRYGHWR